MRIDVYSHGFSVTDLTPPARGVVSTMCRLLGHYGYRPRRGGGYDRVLERVYAGATADRNIFWFLRGELERFLALVRDQLPGEPIITHHGIYEPTKVEYTLLDTRTPFDYQIPAIEYLTNLPALAGFERKDLPGDTRLLTMGPGRGKTMVLNRAIVMNGVRAGFVIKPMYIPKWIGDIESAIKMEKGELIVIQGSAQLIQLMQAALDNNLDKMKIVLISNATYRNYLDAYQLSNGNPNLSGYPVNPHEFWELLGVGMACVDEVHQDSHFNYRLALYSHVPSFNCLSGTIDPDDGFKREMTAMLFPPKGRYVEVKPPPYLDAVALEYHLRSPDKMRWTPRGRTSYSQIALEKSIMQSKRTLKNYVNMFVTVTDYEFIPIYQNKYRMLIYVGTKAMCGHVTEALKEAYPHIRVVRFNSGDDPPENLKTGEIIVTTLKSCGTAQDLPGLAITFMSDALNDTQANLQALKRLRKPPPGDPMKPKFLYGVCRDIPQSVDYHHKKVKIFEGEVVTHQLLSTEFCI